MPHKDFQCPAGEEEHPRVVSQCSKGQTDTLGCWKFETVLISKSLDTQMLFPKPDIYDTVVWNNTHALEMVSDKWDKGKAYLYKSHLIISYERVGRILFFFLFLFKRSCRKLDVCPIVRAVQPTFSFETLKTTKQCLFCLQIGMSSRSVMLVLEDVSIIYTLNSSLSWSAFKGFAIIKINYKIKILKCLVVNF